MFFELSYFFLCLNHFYRTKSTIHSLSQCSNMIFYDVFKGFGSVIAFYCISTKHVHTYITKLFFCSIATNFDVSVTKTENVEYAELRYFFHFSTYFFFKLFFLISREIIYVHYVKKFLFMVY